MAEWIIVLVKPEAIFLSFKGLNRDFIIRSGEDGARDVSDVFVCSLGVTLIPNLYIY